MPIQCSVLSSLLMGFSSCLSILTCSLFGRRARSRIPRKNGPAPLARVGGWYASACVPQSLAVLGSTNQAPARARLWLDGRGSSRIIPRQTQSWPHYRIRKRNSLQTFGGWLDLHWSGAHSALTKPPQLLRLRSGWISRGGQNKRHHTFLNLVSF